MILEKQIRIPSKISIGYSVALIHFANYPPSLINEQLDYQYRQIAKEKATEDQKNTALGNITTYNDLAKGVAEANLVVEAATDKVLLYFFA